MKEKYSSLWAYINNQEQTIQDIFAKLESIDLTSEDKIVHAAYLMHNLYSAYEDMFKEVSICFENNIERSSGFHKNLLTRMKLAIPGIRPFVLSEKSFLLLGEMMGFRHVFRHSYSYNLEPERLEKLREKILLGRTAISSDIELFKTFLLDKFSS
jgi:hypothetical protein